MQQNKASYYYYESFHVLKLMFRGRYEKPTHRSNLFNCGKMVASTALLSLLVVILYHSSIVYAFNIVLAGGTGKVGELLVRYTFYVNMMSFMNYDMNFCN